MEKIQYEVIPITSIIIGFIGMVLFGGASLLVGLLNYKIILEFNKESLVFSICLLLFILLFLLSFYLVIYCQKIIITNESISIKRITKLLSIEYAEINYFYEGSGNINIGNSTKQISFPAYDYWSGRNKREAFLKMISLLKERNIERKISLKGIIPHIKGF